MTELLKLSQYALYADVPQFDRLVYAFLQTNKSLRFVKKPSTTDSRQLVMAAALIELFCNIKGQNVPVWTREGIGSMGVPFFIEREALKSSMFREICYEQCPDYLARKNIFVSQRFIEGIKNRL